MSGGIGDLRKIVVHDGHRGPKETGVSPEFFRWLTDPVENGAEALFLAKITSAFILIAFPLAQIGQPDELLTVKTSELHFNFWVGWNVGEAQLRGGLGGANRRLFPLSRSPQTLGSY